ncbi:hypothetical protein [Thiohalorhabdus methylotrophus]|uniref:Uncharacterized protein n=1 Tax=Thiohalorhabdus methylotrophus TaxID=3242694 RepID=A0ABV4TTI0_9GAMM
MEEALIQAVSWLQVAAVAAIRTALNLFLQRELREMESQPNQKIADTT